MEITTKSGIKFEIDDEDYDKIKQFKWYPHKRKTVTYIVCDGPTGRMQLQRLLLPVPHGYEVDHVDGNGLNNRKGNLRICTHRQNQYNKGPQSNCKSGLKGVSWHKGRKRWQAFININDTPKFIGHFKTKEEAALAYNEQANLLHGEFARLNVL